LSAIIIPGISWMAGCVLFIVWVFYKDSPIVMELSSWMNVIFVTFSASTLNYIWFLNAKIKIPTKFGITTSASNVFIMAQMSGMVEVHQKTYAQTDDRVVPSVFS
jgi:hypothetical protein